MENVFPEESELPPPRIDVWSEDCLTLNVYTPALKGKHDVLLYIHGGGWQNGTHTCITNTLNQKQM